MGDLFTEPEDLESDGEPYDVGEALVKVQTTIPGTLDAIASQNERAMAIIESRVEVLDKLRLWSIKMTDEHDWVLYRREDDDGLRVISGYLQDQGCRRIAAFWGVEDLQVSEPQRIETTGAGRCKLAGPDIPGEDNPHNGLHARQVDCDGWIEIKNWYYVVRGSARSNFSHQVTESLEGMASGEDDFLKKNKKPGPSAEMWARGAARTRWDGKAVRALSGLKNILIATILPGEPNDAWRLSHFASIWEGTGKDWKRCPTGRGFKKKSSGGSYSSSAAVGDKAKPANRPRCPKCKGPTNITPDFFVCAKAKATPPCDGKVAI